MDDPSGWNTDEADRPTDGVGVEYGGEGNGGRVENE